MSLFSLNGLKKLCIPSLAQFKTTTSVDPGIVIILLSCCVSVTKFDIVSLKVCQNGTICWVDKLAYANSLIRVYTVCHSMDNFVKQTH